MISNHLFKQCVEFPLTKRPNKAHYSHWSGYGNSTISSILATLGLFKGTRSEYTSNFQHTHMSLNRDCFCYCVKSFMGIRISTRIFFYFHLFNSYQKFGYFLDVEPKYWTCIVMKNRKWSKRKF